MADWTDQHHQRLAEVYARILREQHAGRPTDKRKLLEQLEHDGMGKRRQNMEASCQQYSEVLFRHGIAWVEGWKPTSLCGRSSPSEKQVARLWRILRPALEREGIVP